MSKAGGNTTRIDVRDEDKTKNSLVFAEPMSAAVVDSILQQICKNARHSNITAHSIRRGLARDLANLLEDSRGLATRGVAEALGHANESTTKIYVGQIETAYYYHVAEKGGYVATTDMLPPIAPAVEGAAGPVRVLDVVGEREDGILALEEALPQSLVPPFRQLSHDYHGFVNTLSRWNEVRNQALAKK